MGFPRSLYSICLQYGRPGFYSWVRKIPWRRKWQPTLVFLPGESHGQRSLVGYSSWDRKSWTRLSDLTSLHFTNPGDMSLIPGSGRSPGEGNGYPLQYSCLENSMDRGVIVIFNERSVVKLEQSINASYYCKIKFRKFEVNKDYPLFHCLK